MSASFRKNLVRLSPIATIVALSFACGSESGPGDGAGGVPGATGGATITGGSSSSGGSANNSGGTANSTGGNSSPTGGAQNTGGGAPGTGGASSTGGETGDSGGSPGTGGGGNETAADCSPKEGEVPVLKLTQVGGNIEGPVYTTHPPNDDRLFVIEIGGRVRLVKDGSLVATPFLDIASKVYAAASPGDETGLLGIAFHPDYATNGLFYVHYSDGNDPQTADSIVEEYKVSSDPDVADTTSARLVLKVDQPNNGSFFRNHKGGSIAFGLDKMLYLGFGDGGGSNDPNGNGQNLSTLLGKILRINPVQDGPSAYTSPAGNLKDSVSEALPEIWDYGLRNPFRFTFDVCNGDLYIGDVGQDAYEEIDIEKAGEGHHNYGWNRMEGLHCFSPMTNCDETGITLPYIEVPASQGTSITGGAVYRGTSMPALRGAYFYADWQTNRVWYTFFDRDAEAVSTPVSVTQDLNASSLVAITNGNDGELYFTSLGPNGGEGPGAIYKLEAAE